MKETMIEVRGEGLTLTDVVQVARDGQGVEITGDAEVRERIEASYRFVDLAVKEGRPVYGVTTSFGAMASVSIPAKMARDLQNNMLWFLKTGSGQRLPSDAVRAGMLLRLNSLVRGVSGVRMEILERFSIFLNRGVTPHVLEFGSIGASGDLVPLSYLAGSIAGLGTGHEVDHEGRAILATEALARLGLAPLPLEPKEGLALVNGTSMLAGIAALCLHDTERLLDVSLAIHALAIQALCGSESPFLPFPHQEKPHPGQVEIASRMRHLLAGSKMTLEGLSGHYDQSAPDLVQDRYSLRCLPQYLAPVLEGLTAFGKTLEIEINSATDNPLFDAAAGESYNCGNFLGQSVAVGADQLRHFIGLVAKHLDVQMALLVAPEFSNGLPASLVGNPERPVNIGLKSVQIAGNSIMPILLFLGQSIADRYPTYAEQYNQNISSQGYAAANLARQSVDTFRHYLAHALMIAVQAVDLRTRALAGHHDARECLSGATGRVYQAFRDAVGVPPAGERAYIHDDHDLERDVHLERVVEALGHGGPVLEAAKFPDYVVHDH